MNLYPKRIIAILLCAIALIPSAIPASASTGDVTWEIIGMGGGGCFTAPLISPLDSSHYIAASDMGGLYYTDNEGSQWQRTNSPRIIASCYADDGTLFAGGCGLYMSHDGGKTLKMIYPREEDVQYSMVRTIYPNPVMIAEGYDNGYVLAVDIHGDFLYFTTLSWESTSNARLYRCRFDGSGLELLYSCNSASDPLSTRMHLEAEEERVFLVSDARVLCFDLVTGKIATIFTPGGKLVDFEKIGNAYYILDDSGSKTDILYTDDFQSYKRLNDYNKLTNYFSWGPGQEYTFQWHFGHIAGTDQNNIWISFHSPLPGRSDIRGILKFDGTQFHWVIDQVFTWSRHADNLGWGYGGISEATGLSVDPNDSNHCIMSNDTTVLDLRFDEEGNHTVKALHTTSHTIGGEVTYQTNGLDIQTSFFVKEDPFDPDTLLIGSSDLGMQISHDSGTSFHRPHELYEGIYNTCYDVYHDREKKNVVYGLWSAKHDVGFGAKYGESDSIGGFGISYNRGLDWDFEYSTGIPENSIPIKMSIVDIGDELMIAVATFDNGFYISYDTGRTFSPINNGIPSYNGMIWGNDIIIAGRNIYCLTSHCHLDQSEALVPAALYQYNLDTRELTVIEMDQAVIANSLAYSEEFGLYVGSISHHRLTWFEEYGAYGYENYGGGVYKLVDGHLEQIFENRPGVFDVSFSQGILYVSCVAGEIYTMRDGEFSLYAKGLFPSLKNITFSEDEKSMYITSFGGGVYRMPALDVSSDSAIPDTTDPTVANDPSAPLDEAANPTNAPKQEDPANRIPGSILDTILAELSRLIDQFTHWLKKICS